MWQRFTERARKVVFYAQEEAQRVGDAHVSTEHLLLGLVREDDSVSARVLTALGVSLNRLRVEVEKQLPQGEPNPLQNMTLSPRGKRVIDLACEESRMLDNDYIGTEHLLLGLVREGEGLAGLVLAKLGVDLENARLAVEAIQVQAGTRPKTETKNSKPPVPPANPWDRFDDGGRRAALAAEEEALRRGQTFRSTEHILLGLLRERENKAARALVVLGVDLDALYAKTELWCRTGDQRVGEAPLSPASNQAFVIAYKEQSRTDAPKTGAEHILLGLMRESDGIARRVLEEFGVDVEGLREAIRSLSST